MKTIISNEITIEQPTEEIKKWCEDNLVYKNPEYEKKKRMGLWLGKTPKKFYMYKVSGNKYVLPFGVLKKIWSLIKKDKFEVNFKAKKIYPRSLINLYDYQEEAVNKMLNARNGVLVSKAGSGKGHTLDTILYTPTGTIKLRDLKVGDSLIGSNGNPIKVTNIFERGVIDTYKVTFTDDSFIECDGDHLFTFQTRFSKKNGLNIWHTKSVKWIKKRLKHHKEKYYIPIVRPVKFESKDVDIEPWLLGFSIATEGKIELRDKKIKDSIPDDYKYNDINTRLNVLRGIVDGSGAIDKNNKIYVTVFSKQFARDIKEIVESLGGTVFIRNAEISGCNNLYINLNRLDFFTNKKFKNYKKIKSYRAIKEIEYIGKKEIRCISVDSEDKLYVAKDFIVTHNTQMMLDLICRLGYKALWINNKKDLMNQALERAKANIVNCTFGTITEGKINIGDITFSTIQTLVNSDLESLKNEFAIIIVDEFQNCSGSPTKITQFYKVLSKLAARYKFGCTACVHRSDGLMQMGLDLIGEVVHEVPESAIADKIVRAKIKTVHTEFEPTTSLGADGILRDFASLINDVCYSRERNDIIIEEIKKEKNNHCIVLSDRLDQLRYLKENLGYGIMIDGSMVSKKGKEQRRQAIEKMKSGEETVLFATYSLAKEGLDIPILDRLFMASPKKDKSVIIQAVGRIERACDGKAEPIVYDFVDDFDDDFKTLLNMFKARKTIYKKNGNEII